MIALEQELTKDRDFTKEEFATSREPYELVFQCKDKFEQASLMQRMSQKAVKAGFRGFKSMYKSYVDSRKASAGATVLVGNVTEFTGQPLELNAGTWLAGDDGIYRASGYNGEEIACLHPIMPVERYVNIDTGEEKLKLAYRKGVVWRTAIVAKTILASTNKVTELAGIGIAVTSQNARNFIQYISDIENLNYDIIPERRSIGRLGYIKGEGFSPYVEGLTFDGDASFSGMFNSVQSEGSETEWLAMAREVRNSTTVAKIMLAASFASPLLEPVGSLPFFVHLWSSEGGTGKTVALMVAASVWGNPAVGSYIKTFNSTEVGSERTAAFLNHLPLCMDELQLAKDGKGRQNFNVYKLAEGSGKTRATKYGGIDITPTWRCSILTTGENPMTGESSGSGEVQRVINVECTQKEPAIRDGHRIANLARQNYGFAGRRFVEKLYESPERLEKISARYQELLGELYKSDKAEKQVMAAAALIVADELACEWIFGGEETPLTIEELDQVLATKTAVNLGARAYQFICDWVGQNSSKLCQNSENGEVYGALEDDSSGATQYAYIIRTVLNSLLTDAGYNPSAVISYLKGAKILQTRGRHNTKAKRINNVPTECYCIKLPIIEEDFGSFDMEPL